MLSYPEISYSKGLKMLDEYILAFDMEVFQSSVVMQRIVHGIGKYENVCGFYLPNCMLLIVCLSRTCW